MNIILDKFKNYWRNQNDKISTRIKFTLFKTNKFTAISSIVSVMLAVSLIITMVVFSSHAKQSVINEVKMYMEIWIYQLDITLIKIS